MNSENGWLYVWGGFAVLVALTLTFRWLLGTGLLGPAV